MSPDIWTRCGGRRNCRIYEGQPWRVVEAQHLVSTRRLVDSDEELHLLEELIDSVKPPLPADDGIRELHYLLSTPFRHPPLRHGSRFGTRHEPSLWYGAEDLRTCLAEVAYYRFVFLFDAPELRVPLTVELSAFQASVRSAAAVDLTAPPFQAFAPLIASPTSYQASQRLGSAMRADGVEVIRYPSARLPGGVNVALFTAAAFAHRRPTTPQTWICVADRERIEVSRKDYFVRESHTFERVAFEVGGRLPLPPP